MKKRIVLSILPIFALAACSDPEVQSVDRYTAPNPQSNVVTNSDGSYSQSAQEVAVSDESKVTAPDEQFTKSFNDARAQGFNGTYEEWVEISKLHETDPAAAQSRAEDNGFSGGEMLFAALAGMALGGLAAKAFNGKDNTSRSYSQQRLNNTTNYASVQKYDDRERERDRGGSGSGTAMVGGSTGAAAASAQKRSNVSLSKKSNSSNSSYSARSSSSYGSVARGGFGGSSSSSGG